MAEGSRSKRVAVIGGGVAGITAAVKLWRQGFDVTIFEKEDHLGGNLSSNSPAVGNRRKFRADVYPHIFGDWYREFWYLLEVDLRIDRQNHFAPRDSVCMATAERPKAIHQQVANGAAASAAVPKPVRFDQFEFRKLSPLTSLRNLADDLVGSALSPRDMYLFGYSVLDLVSRNSPGDARAVMEQLDVNGYLFSRPYMRDAVAQFHDDTLETIWSMPSSQTSASSYSNLVRHTYTFPDQAPFGWFLQGEIGVELMAKVEERLRDNIGVVVGNRVDEIAVGQNRIELKVSKTPGALKPSNPGHEALTADYVVIATPAKAALDLALRSDRFVTPSKGPARSMLSVAPSLACLREAEYARIPVVYLRFNKDLGKLPDELIGFQPRSAASATKDKNCELSVLNLTRLWKNLGADTVLTLAVAASRPQCLSAPAPGEPGAEAGKAEGFALIRQLHEHFPVFDLGDSWGGSGDIDWTQTFVVSNQDFQLFLNDAGSNAWRPAALVEGLRQHNVFLAGDYCRTDVDMATVEAAAQSGVLAAMAVQKAAQGSSPIALQGHDLYGSAPLQVAKLAMAPAAWAASLSAAYDEAETDPIKALSLPFSAASLTVSYWADWLRTALLFWREALPHPEASAAGEGAEDQVADHDHRIGLLGAAANLAVAAVLEGPATAPKLGDAAIKAAYATWIRCGGRLLFPKLPSQLTLPARAADPPAPPKGAPPSTWTALAQRALGVEGLRPREIAGAAFELAVETVERRRPLDEKGEPKSFASDKDRDDHARAVGKSARRDFVSGFRRYPNVRELVTSAQPLI